MKKVAIFFLCYFQASSLALAQKTMTSEAEYKAYFSARANALNDIEGIWQVSTKQYYYKYDTLYDVIEAKKAARVAIIEKDGKYQSYILSGEPYNVEFTKTDVKGVYFYRNYFVETKEYSKTDAVISKAGEMKYEYEIPDKMLQLKMMDLYEEGIHVNNEVEWAKVFPQSDKK